MGLSLTEVPMERLPQKQWGLAGHFVIGFLVWLNSGLTQYNHCGFVMLSANQLLALGHESSLVKWYPGLFLMRQLSIQSLAQRLNFKKKPTKLCMFILFLGRVMKFKNSRTEPLLPG